MPTLVKGRENSATYVTCSTEEVVSWIKTGRYRFEPTTPRVRFAADYQKQKGQLVLKRYCGIAVLCVGNLASEQESAEAIAKAINVPHTHIAWRSDDKRSVYIVSRIAWRDDSQPEHKQMVAYQQNAYKLLHYLYSAQLVMSIDTEAPTLSQEIPLCFDPGVYFNLNSLPVYVGEPETDVPTIDIPHSGAPTNLIPGMNEEETRAYIFQSCRQKALAEARTKSTNEAEWEEKALILLAKFCHESGLPIDYATNRARWLMGSNSKNIGILELTFRNAYAKDLMKEVPFGHIEKSALLTIQTESFLNAFYTLRRNSLTGEVQYREKTSHDYNFRPLTEQVLNSMTIRALKAGLGSWDKDVRRIINSNDVRIFDPLAEYLYSIPKWDGKNHVGELVDRIPTSYEQVSHHFHTWLLSMVAHWLGKDKLHGNAIVPLFIGAQGCRKTTFASLILPPELRDYFNDKVDFRSDSDLFTGLSRYALINIDEFDSLKKSQQPTLKYLLSKSEVKFRPSYGKTIEQRRRYASFIATTNLSHPLVDRTGSRRFLCIPITAGQIIDTSTPIPYEQLYAQLLAEINQGMRYWFDEEETQEIQIHNAPFTRLTSLSEMIDTVLEKPSADGDGANLYIGDILNHLLDTFPYLTPTNNTHRELGVLLREKGFTPHRTNTGTQYLVCLRKL